MRKAFLYHDVITTYTMPWINSDSKQQISWSNHHHNSSPWWRHQMEIFSGIHRSTVNTPHRGQWREALMYSLICVWINVWVNNRDAGDLRRYRAHYDVTVMFIDNMHVNIGCGMVIRKLECYKQVFSLTKTDFESFVHSWKAYKQFLNCDLMNIYFQMYFIFLCAV